ncbi:hypothetical protein MTR67_046563 [Solanum verrucosum]|uniref:C-JID domain-containing protein n=1 Tax=Solanum verrucosum TaxID=315347 RepID=A0AAF0ZXC2_SOLVR|nr:hypothetical protein MTR67_046563 [Solanum verrucosum]
MENLVALPSNICKLKGLVKLIVCCSKLESLPEEIGDLENLKELHARDTLISLLPSSIVRLDKMETPEDIGCLSSLKELNLSGNSFEYLPRSIAQLGALRSLDLSDCKRFTQLPEFPQQLHTIDADWSNDWICNSLFQNISLLQYDISASDSLSLRVFMSLAENIPRWFHHQENGFSISLKLPENWYAGDAYHPKNCLIQPSRMSCRICYAFFLVPLAGLWDTSKANGRTPNDYGRIRLYSPGERKEFGLRLLYKDEPKIEASCSSSQKQ